MSDEIGVLASPGADTGAEASAAEPIEVSTGVETTPEVEASVDPTQETTTETTPGAQEPNVRQYMDKFLKGDEYKKLQATNPQLAKAMRNNHMALSNISRQLQPFGGISGLTKMVESITGVGGIEALPEMASRLEEYEQIDAKLEAGDPDWINSIASEMPEVFGKMMPTAIGKWAETNPEQFGQYRAKLLVDEVFQRDHVYDYLVDAFRSLPDNDQNKQGKALINEIAKWFNGQKQVAAKQQNAAKPGQGKEADPLAQQKAELAQEKQNITLGKANTSTMAYCYPVYAKEAAKFGLKLEGEDLKDFQKFVDQNIQQKIAGDQAFQKQFKARLAKGDADGITNLTKPYVDKYVSDAVKQVYEQRFKGRGRFANIKQQVATTKPIQQQQKPSGNGASQLPSKAILVARKPDVSLMDTKNTTPKMIMNHQAYLKDGRLVKWS